MRLRTLILPAILALLAIVVVFALANAPVAYAQPVTATEAASGVSATAAPAAETIPPDKRFQMPGAFSCIPMITFEFVKCIGAPLSIYTSAVMISMGAAILQLGGALFDFGVDRLIINFKDTLDGKLGLIDIINNGWTFFRDLANILIIGIFVFIAISLILGLKEYGQKKMIARVLIIAVLLNFSLLFTKIIIDASNFVAYSIYSQTASSCSTTSFSIADCMLKPLRITSISDTSQLTTEIFAQVGGGAGAVKTIIFGIFGFIVLALLGVVIMYGAFLIIARAILFFILMLTAPLAYATYLAPHFEASQFGWKNWWKSLINNAAFAPLLMMFVSITILIVQTASKSVGTGTGTTLTPLLMDPTKLMLVDGWRILFLYILGTGLLFASFRISSSLAGSISGIKLGQSALGVPLAFGAAMGFRGAAAVAQNTVGRKASKEVDRINRSMNDARINKDWGKLEQLRKEKAKQEKRADSSFNMMNTGLGKALAQKAGLKGAASGESKGGFVTKAHDKAVKAEPAAKATRLTEENKNKIRKDAKENVTAETKKKDEEKKDLLAKDLEGAKAILEAAHKEVEAAEATQKKTEDPKEKEEAEAKVVENTIAKAPEAHKAQEEVRVIEKQRTDTAAGQDRVIQTMIKETEKLSGQAKDDHIRNIEAKKAEHAQAIKAIDARITTAKDKVNTIDSEIKAPLTQLAQRQKDAADTLKQRRDAETLQKQNIAEKESAISNFKETSQREIDKEARDRADKQIKETEESGLEYVAQKAATKEKVLTGEKIVDHDVEHIVQHHFDEQYKSTSNSKRLLDRLERMEKNEEKKL